MPTENRSSNTETISELLPCPFCGQQDFLIERLDSDASVVICQGLTGPYEACLARGPVGVVQDEGEDQPGRDKAVELWNARAEQHQGEPVAWMIDWPEEPELGHYFSDESNPGARSRPLYTHPDAGEVERLRKVTAFVQRLIDCAGSQQSVATGYLRDILDELKGSAMQPQPVGCAICSDLGDQCLECEEAEFREWAERHFAKADYRKTAAGVFIQDWMRHSYAAWCARSTSVRKP